MAQAPLKALSPEIVLPRGNDRGDPEGFGPEVFSAFCALIPLGNRAEDFGVSLLAVAENRTISDQAAYDTFFQSVDVGWRTAFHAEFYRQRDRLRESDSEHWLALHKDYPWFSELLHRHGRRGRIAVVTAKDRPSVAALLSHFGLDAVFDPELIFDKDTGVQKTAHLTRLAERTRMPYPSIVFVDDKVNHLRSTAPLGVRGILAGWGENGEREHDLARRHGFAVAFPENTEHLLFD